MNILEVGMTNINAELTEIKCLIANLSKNPAGKQSSQKSQENEKKGNIWFNQEKLASVKAPPTESLLVVNKTQVTNGNATLQMVEKAIIDNGIPVTKIFKNNMGDLVLVYDTADSRDKLNDIIASKDDIQTKTMSKKRPSITTVGLSKSITKDEVVDQMVSQNQFIKSFSMANDIKKHIEIFDVRSTRANPSVFQAFAAVREVLREGGGGGQRGVLREGLRNYEDKVAIGLMNCKVYDRYHTKRCNNCQAYDHYYKDCPIPNTHCCAKCSLEHPTNSYDDTRKCINCTKTGISEVDHAAYDHNCPSLLNHLQKMKEQYKKHLNWRKHMGDHH